MFYSLNKYLCDTYGHKLYKLSLSCSDTCPNRDGTKSTGGCIFCSSKGSGDFASCYLDDIDTQIEKAKEKVNKKYKGNEFIAYFQSFTSTYGDINKLKDIFYKTIERNDIKILSIATRPDCINNEMLELLNNLNKIKPVWIELGLQTTNETTAKLINRCYENKIYFDIVNKLRKLKINVITHVIIGLPNETKEDLIKTINDIKDYTDGIKFTVLHVLRNTKLEKLYYDNKYIPVTRKEYTEYLVHAIRLLPKNIVIHRITGDPDKNEFISPNWTKDKKYNLQYIYDYFLNNNYSQGDLYKTTSK